MNQPAPFWIPSVFRIDGQAHGRFDETLIAEGLNADPVLRELGINTRFIEDFLEETASAFEALFLAGYKVPWFEVGLQSVVNSPINSGQMWLRFDLQNRRLEVNHRADTDHSNRIRLHTMPIQTADRNFALDLGRNALADLMTRAMPMSMDAAETLDHPMHMFMQNMMEGDGDVPPDYWGLREDATLSVSEYRTFQALLLGAGIEGTGTAEFPLRFDVDVPAFDKPRDATRVIFKGFRHAIFDTITWIVGNAVLDATDLQLDRLTAGEIEGDALSDPSALPGMVWVLNPETWTGLWPDTPTMFEGLPQIRAELQVVAQIMFDLCKKPQPVMFSDLLSPGSQVTDPPPSAFAAEKRAGYLYGLIYGTGLEIAREPAIASPEWHGRPLERVVDVILGHSARKSRRERTRPDKWKETKPVVIENPHAKVTDSLEGLLYALLLALVDPTDRPAVPSEVDNLLDIYWRAYRTLITHYGDSQGLINAATATGVARRESYLATIISLFNLGVFSIEMHIGDLNADLPVAGVDVFEDVRKIPTFGSHLRWRFQHKLYDHPGILVWQHDTPAESGLTLGDLVAWEYVPAQPEPPEAIKTALVQLGLFPADNRDKLILVAGPGIMIRETETWPASVALEIHRVQSPALVPDLNERVNVKSIASPYVISVLDDIRHVSGNNIYRKIDRRHELHDLAVEHADRVPFVTVTPVRKDGKCGITIATKYPANAYYRGIDGMAAVEVLVDERSGSDRFAFDIEYDIHTLKRAVGTHTESRVIFHPGSNTEYHHDETITDHDEVDVAQFKIIVKATEGVEININDNKIGPFYDLFVDVFGGVLRDFADPIDDTMIYEFWRTSDMAKVPVQGTPLDDGRGFSRDHDPYRLRNDEAIVEHLKFMIDLGIGFVPVVGEATDAIELLASLYTGTDRWGRPITNFDRALIAGGLALPLVSSRTLKVIGGEMPANTLLKSMAGLE